MKFILAQPSIKRFQWELEVLLTNLKSLGNEHEVVLLFSKPDGEIYDSTVPSYLANKYGCSVFVYDDKRENKRYIPSIKPYLFYRYLDEDSAREQESYFYIDSDLLFRELPDFATLGANEQTWVGSDCHSYIDYNYIVNCRQGPKIAAKLAEITGITLDQMKATPGAGAQWLITNPTAEFWLRVYKDSNKIYEYLEFVNSDIQKWTAEMWAQIFGTVRIGKTVTISKEIDFCMPTDNISRWDEVKILHNAGVTGSGEMFFKGQYVHHQPFGEDFSAVRRDKASFRYVEAVESVVL